MKFMPPADTAGFDIIRCKSVSLPWSPHEGEPHMWPERALQLYRDHRSELLARGIMTEEQRANYIGDSKPS